LNHDENNSPALKLKLALPTESMSLFFARRWKDMADGICAFLMAKLSQE
jgi:hypothetical protein